MSSLNSLPLRLWAPPNLRSIEKYGHPFRNHVLDISTSNSQTLTKLTVVLDDYGILGIVLDWNHHVLDKYVKFVENRIVSNQLSQEIVNESLLFFSPTPAAPIVSFLLVRLRSGAPFFVPVSSHCKFSKELAIQHLTVRKKTVLYPSTAQRIVNGIFEYYKTQILEPSVRGFLFILEKQFPRNDLYLFELLQNAVDDGASFVSFKCFGNPDNEMVRVTHNGRRFTPLDVIGLSSVGLSTKTSKRTIGFMGIGFKAVYKRFHKVHISDGTFSFRFEKPHAVNTSKVERDDSTESPNNRNPDVKSANNGWVMLPSWVKKSEKSDGDRSSWCRFDLSRCVGGISAAQKDLQYIPFTCPPLLGRTALNRAKVTGMSSWTLDWNGKVYQVTRVDDSGILHDHPDQLSPSWVFEKYVVNLCNSENKVLKTSRWIFIKTDFKPTRKAADAFSYYTRKKYQNALEEVCIFFKQSSKSLAPLCPKYTEKKDSRNKRLGSGPPKKCISGGGLLHSVLPTKLKLPFGFHLQSSWLLSVDRQDIQDSFENPWNRELLLRIPTLLLAYLHWIKELDENDVTTLSHCYQMFPCDKVEENSATKACELSVIGVNINLNVVENAILTKRLLPVHKSELENDKCADKKKSHIFCQGNVCIMLPQSFVKNLSPAFLHQWLSLNPVDTVALGHLSCCALLRKVNVVNGKLLGQRAEALYTLFVEHGVYAFLRLYAAFGEALGLLQESTISDSGNSGNNGQANEADSVDSRDSFLDKIDQWHIFPAVKPGKCVSCTHLRFPDDEYYKLSNEQQKILQPYVTRSEDYLQKLRKYNIDLHNYNKVQESLRRTKHNKHGGKYRKNNKSRRHKQNKSIVKQPVKPLEPTMIDQRLWLEMTKLAYSKEASFGNDAISSAHMKVFLDNIRKKTNSTVLTVDIIDCLLKDLAGKEFEIDESMAKEIVVFTFMKNKFNAPVKYIMCNHDTKESIYKLVDINHAFLSADYGSKASKELHAFWENVKDIEGRPEGACVNFTSSIYYKYMPNIDWCSIFRDRMHLNDGIRLVAIKETMTRKNIVDARSTLKEKIEIRKSKKEVTLPYGLGNLSSKQGTVAIDVDFADVFVWFLEYVSTRVSNAKGARIDVSSKNHDPVLHNISRAASAFSSLLGYIELDDDKFEHSGFLDEHGKHIRIRLELKASVDGIVDSKLDSKGSKLRSFIAYKHSKPTRKRIFFLPPKKPGVSILDLGVKAMWINRLINSTWVPVKPQGAFVATLASPPAAQFIKDRDTLKPYLQEIDLPVYVSSCLIRNGIYKAAEFQSKTPPSPIEAFTTFAKRAEAGASATTFEEATAAWLNLFGHGDGNSFPVKDMLKVKAAAKKHSLIPCRISYKQGEDIALLQDIDSNDGFVLLPLIRCCSPNSLNVNQDNANDDRRSALRKSLIDSKWLIDLRDTPLAAIAKNLSNLLDLKCWVTDAQCEAYLKWLFLKEPEPYKNSAIINGYALALEKLLFVTSTNDASRVRQPPINLIFDLKLCVYSLQKRRYTWVHHENIFNLSPRLFSNRSSAHKAGKLEKIRVYANNNWKVELLLKQVLIEKDIRKVILPKLQNESKANYTIQNSNYNKICMESAKQIVRALNIPCLGDKKYFSVGIKSEGSSVQLDIEIRHLNNVIDIYYDNQDQLQNKGDIQRRFQIPPKFLHCEKLFRIYRIYDDEPIRKTCWCAWLGKNAIKVQGDTEDYVAELVEELTRRIPRHLFPPSPKLLNLLHYLNDAQKFNKFAKRYFNYTSKPGEMALEDSTKSSTKKRKRCSSPSNTSDVDKSDALEPGSIYKRPREETNIPTPVAGGAVAVGRGRGLTVPAWMSKELPPADTPIGVKPEGNLNFEPARRLSSGRGVTNTPGWMARDMNGRSDDINFTPPSVVNRNIEVVINAKTRPPAIGRGSAINTPAWMQLNGTGVPNNKAEADTQRNITAVEDSKIKLDKIERPVPVKDNGAFEDGNFEEVASRSSSREVQAFLNSVECEQSSKIEEHRAEPVSNLESQIPAAKSCFTPQGMGRGRNLTIPAWMNNGTFDKSNKDPTDGTGVKPVSQNLLQSDKDLPSLVFCRDGNIWQLKMLQQESLDGQKPVDEKSLREIPGTSGGKVGLRRN